MKSHFHKAVALILVCLLPVAEALCGDLTADTVIADELKTRGIGPDAAAPGNVRMPDGMSLRGVFSVGGDVLLPDGIPGLQPLGDVPMGSFTNVSGVAGSCSNAPSWWEDRCVAGTGAVNDYAAAVQGQVKWIALQAAAEFDFCLGAVGGAGAAVSNLIGGFSLTNNSLPVTLGQLKNAAKPFHDRLMEAGIATNYPWSGQAEDFALANIGQVKFLFAFDFGRDTDRDGMPDGWEVSYGLDPADCGDAFEDADSDSIVNVQEFVRGTDPSDPASVNGTLYADSDIGNALYDGYSQTALSASQGPKATVQQAVDASISGDVIEIRGQAAFSDTIIVPGSKNVRLRPIGNVRF